MPKRKIVAVQNDEAWNHYLIEAFEDTPSTPEIVKTVDEGLPIVRRDHPDVVFVNAKLLTKPFVAALQGHRSANPDFRVFSLGTDSASPPAYPFDSQFDGIPSTLNDFQKRLAEHLPLPDPIQILVADDEPEVGEIFRDYFEHRTGPAFVIRTAPNGVEAERLIQKEIPHVLVLDIKMPEKDGRELYRELRQKGLMIPTIIFFDLVSADEVLEVRHWGSPAFVEKGAQASSMPAMAALIKKLAFFG